LGHRVNVTTTYTTAPDAMQADNGISPPPEPPPASPARRAAVGNIAPPVGDSYHAGRTGKAMDCRRLDRAA